MKIFILFLVLLCNLAACVAPISETSNHNDIIKKCATDRDCPPAEYCRSGGCSKKPGTFASLKVRNDTAEELASEDTTAGIPVVNTDDEKVLASHDYEETNEQWNVAEENLAQLEGADKVLFMEVAMLPKRKMYTWLLLSTLSYLTS